MAEDKNTSTNGTKAEEPEQTTKVEPKPTVRPERPPLILLEGPDGEELEFDTKAGRLFTYIKPDKPKRVKLLVDKMVDFDTIRLVRLENGDTKAFYENATIVENGNHYLVSGIGETANDAIRSLFEDMLGELLSLNGKLYRLFDDAVIREVSK